MNNKLHVITYFSNNQKIRFNLDHSVFFDTLKRDFLRRLDQWLDNDNELEFKTYFNVTNIKYNFNTNKLELIELTPTTMNGLLNG